MSELLTHQPVENLASFQIPEAEIGPDEIINLGRAARMFISIEDRLTRGILSHFQADSEPYFQGHTKATLDVKNRAHIAVDAPKNGKKKIKLTIYIGPPLGEEDHPGDIHFRPFFCFFFDANTKEHTGTHVGRPGWSLCLPRVEEIVNGWYSPTVYAESALYDTQIRYGDFAAQMSKFLTEEETSDANDALPSPHTRSLEGR